MTEGRKHIYAIDMVWTGAEDGPAKDYRGYSREHRFTAPGKPALLSSADPAFRGDASLYNPEELLLAVLSGCHMLWCLHICTCLLYTSPSPRDRQKSRMPSSA